MTYLLITGGLSAAFLGLFWATPLGVPALRRMGGGQLSPDLTFGARPEAVYALIGRYGSQGVAHWRRLLRLDLMFPLVYGPFLALALQGCGQWAGIGWAGAAMVLPAVAAMGDVLENLTLLRVLAMLPKQRPELVTRASWCTRVKFGALWLALGLLAFFAMLGTVRGL